MPEVTRDGCGRRFRLVLAWIWAYAWAMHLPPGSLRSACHCVGPNDGCNSFIDHRELPHDWVIRVCELKNAIRPEHRALSCLASIPGCRQLVVGDVFVVGLPVGCDVGTELVDYRFEASQAGPCLPE